MYKLQLNTYQINHANFITVTLMQFPLQKPRLTLIVNKYFYYYYFPRYLSQPTHLGNLA